MKKLLGVLAALGFTATTAATVVSCSAPMRTHAIPHGYHYEGTVNNLSLYGVTELFSVDTKEQFLLVGFNRELANYKVDPTSIALIFDGGDGTIQYQFTDDDLVNPNADYKDANGKPFKSPATGGQTIMFKLDKASAHLKDGKKYDVDATRIKNIDGDKLTAWSGFMPSDTIANWFIYTTTGEGSKA